MAPDPADFRDPEVPAMKKRVRDLIVETEPMVDDLRARTAQLEALVEELEAATGGAGT